MPIKGITINRADLSCQAIVLSQI